MLPPGAYFPQINAWSIIVTSSFFFFPSLFHFLSQNQYRDHGTVMANLISKPHTQKVLLIPKRRSNKAYEIRAGQTKKSSHTAAASFFLSFWIWRGTLEQNAKYKFNTNTFIHAFTTVSQVFLSQWYLHSMVITSTVLNSVQLLPTLWFIEEEDKDTLLVIYTWCSEEQWAAVVQHAWTIS